MISDIEQMFKNAGVVLDTRLLTEGVAELKRQYPLISDNDYQQLIRFDPTYKGGNELGKYGRWILDLYNTFVKDRNAEEKYEKAKAYVAEHPEANMPPAPLSKSQDRIEDFQKIPELLADLETHLNDVKEPIANFKSVSDLATAVRAAVEKDVSVDEKAKANYKIFREAMADGLKVVYQDNDWIIGIPETYEASSHFKKPVTNWCTAYPDKYDFYKNVSGGDYYIHLNKHTGDLYQLHYESGQFKDANDREIDTIKFIKTSPQLKTFYDKIIPYDKPVYWPLHEKQPSEEDQLKGVSSYGDYIKYLTNPSYNVQRQAVWRNGVAIKHIKNQTEELQLLALDDDPDRLALIKEPTLAAQLKAVKEYGRAIRFIENPSKEVQLAAVTKTPYALQDIKNPSTDVIKAALNVNGEAIRCVQNQTEELQLLAIKNTPYAWEYLNNPSEKVAMALVSENPSMLPFVSEPTERVNLIAVSELPEMIRVIDNPSEKVQLAAVKRSPHAIKHIKNPTERVKQTAKVAEEKI